MVKLVEAHPRPADVATGPKQFEYPVGHRALAAYHGDECLKAIRAAVANPHPTTVQDHDLLHAVRMARSAFAHAAKAKKER